MEFLWQCDFFFFFYSRETTEEVGTILTNLSPHVLALLVVSAQLGTGGGVVGQGHRLREGAGGTQ